MMKKLKIEYVTSNAGKFEEAQHILNDWQLERVELDIPEVQGDRREIVEAKAKTALRKLKRPLVVEDVSLCFNALGGLPGAYVKEFLIKIGEEGLYNLVKPYKDHSAQAICTVAFIRPKCQPILFEGIIEGTIVAPRGSFKHSKLSWNPIFQPRGSARTFGEMTMKEISGFSERYLALCQLRTYLEEHEKDLIV